MTFPAHERKIAVIMSQDNNFAKSTIDAEQRLLACDICMSFTHYIQTYWLQNAELNSYNRIHLPT